MGDGVTLMSFSSQAEWLLGGGPVEGLSLQVAKGGTVLVLDTEETPGVL